VRDSVTVLAHVRDLLRYVYVLVYTTVLLYLHSLVCACAFILVLLTMNELGSRQSRLDCTAPNEGRRVHIYRLIALSYKIYMTVGEIYLGIQET
jgi:hypothetical protein